MAIEVILAFCSMPKIEIIMGILATEGIFLRKLIIGRSEVSIISNSEINIAIINSSKFW